MGRPPKFAPLLSGDKFSRWTVLEFVGRERDRKMWLCRCDCGTEKAVEEHNLRRGASQSCGCYASELTTYRNLKHGYAGTPTHYSWRAMKDRCTQVSHVGWERYGGRGIVVCPRWNDFENFLEDMGDRPEGKTLHRINDALVYSKETCRWATISEQNRERRPRATA